MPVKNPTVNIRLSEDEAQMIETLKDHIMEQAGLVRPPSTASAVLWAIKKTTKEINNDIHSSNKGVVPDCVRSG